MSKSKPNASIMNLEQMKRFLPIRDRSPELERRYRKESIDTVLLYNQYLRHFTII